MRVQEPDNDIIFNENGYIDALNTDELETTDVFTIDLEAWKRQQIETEREIMRNCKTKVWVNPNSPKPYKPTEREMPFIVGDVFF